MVRTILAGLFCLLSVQAFGEPLSAFNLEIAKKRCQTHYTESPELFADTFKWGYTLLEMSDRFLEMYDSGERLHIHSFYDKEQDQFIIYTNDTKPQAFTITENLIRSVTLHIETAIAKGYADYVFFPDMGHSHFYFPEEHWQKNYASMKKVPPYRDALYQKMLADPELKALYHLAEQLKMKTDGIVSKDPILNFKYWNRNFVGYNLGTRDHDIVIDHEQAYNTVGKIKGHSYWGEGLAISASKDGCFPYRDKDGQVRYFDISIQDPRYDPNSGAWLEQ